jgi:hypothetical protein
MTEKNDDGTDSNSVIIKIPRRLNMDEKRILDEKLGITHRFGVYRMSEMLIRSLEEEDRKRLRKRGKNILPFPRYRHLLKEIEDI